MAYNKLLDVCGQFELVYVWDIIVNHDELVEPLFGSVLNQACVDQRVDLLLRRSHVYPVDLVNGVQQLREALRDVLVVSDQQDPDRLLDQLIQLNPLFLHLR